MSDIRPKRPAREPARIEIGAPAVATATAPAALATAVETAVEPAVEPKVEAVVERQETTAEDALVAFAEAQTALARGAEQIAVELAGMTRSGLTATADAAIALLGAKSFAEAVEINAGLARRSFDTMLEGSSKVSEIAVKSVADASRPLLSGLGLPTQ
jgi:phasin family protein